MFKQDSGTKQLVEIFFENYASAFTSNNPKQIEKAYDFPMTFYTENGESVPFEKKEFTENSNKLIEVYKNIGVESVSFEVESEIKISSVLILASIIWSFKNNEGAEIYNATTKYLMKNNNTDWKIKSVFVINETTKLNELRT